MTVDLYETVPKLLEPGVDVRQLWTLPNREAVALARELELEKTRPRKRVLHTLDLIDEVMHDWKEIQSKR